MVRPRFAPAFLANLIAANERQVQQGLRVCGPRFDVLERTGSFALCALDRLQIILANCAIGCEHGLRKQRGTSDLAVVIAFRHLQPGDDALRILLDRQEHRVL